MEGAKEEAMVVGLSRWCVYDLTNGGCEGGSNGGWSVPVVYLGSHKWRVQRGKQWWLVCPSGVSRISQMEGAKGEAMVVGLSQWCV